MRFIASPRLALVAATLVSLAGPAGAEAPEPTPQEAAAAAAAPAPAPVAPAADQPCRDLLERYCSTVQPGPRRLLECLEAHRDAMSPACRSHVDRARRARERAANAPTLDAQTLLACRADLDTACKGVRSGGGRLHACLSAKTPELSAACRTALARRARAMAAPPTTHPPRR